MLSYRTTTRLCALLTVFLLPFATEATAATLRVCASGCTYSNLQTALNAAQAGDTILLRAGETFVGNFTLPAKSGTAFITIRSDAADSSLPSDGVRLVPEGRTGANTAKSALARILGAGGTLKTTPVVHAAPGAAHYRLQFIDFDGAAQIGYETLIAIGTDTDDPNPPHDIVFDRVYIHGHHSKGQKRGVALNGGATDIINSYIADIKAINADSVGIGGWNGAGPYRIVNNYIEAAGENILFGGASPAIDNLIPSDIEISGNTIRKDPAWQNDILRAPGSFRVSSKGTGGSLASGTHYFKVVAVLPTGTREIVSAPSAEVSASVSSSGSVTLAWTATPDAEKYRIYRGTSSGGESVYITTPDASTSFVYKGSGESSGKPASGGNTWVAKNLLELKNAQRVKVDRNLFENNWSGDQPGYALVFTPRNSAGTSPWVAVRDVTFTNNILRHSAAAINILGYDTTKSSGSAIADHLTFRNNLFYDIDPAGWGGSSPKCIQIGEGAKNVTFDHNTFDHNTTAVLGPYGAPMPGFVFTSNISLYGKYGVMGAGSSPGNPTIAEYFPGAVFTYNVFANGGKASLYPPTNTFVSLAEWTASFADLAGEDYQLLPTSVFYAAGANGSAPGVDVTVLTSPAPETGGGGGGQDPPPSGTVTAVAGGPYSGSTTADITVNGSASSSSNGSISGYRWEFGDDVLLQLSDVPDAALHGAWKKAAVAGAATGIALVNPNANIAKITTAKAAPSSYVDVHFVAAAGVPYYVWFRGKAESDYYGNDSFFVQFDDAVDSLGRQFAAIGSTDALGMVLEEGSGGGLSGWGWNDADYGGLAAPVYFATSGEHVLRLQPREDGIQLDQIVISSRAYAAKRPGAVKNDNTTVPATFGSASGATATHRYATAGVFPVRLTVTDSSGAQGTDTTTATITAGGTSSLAAVAGGPYQGTAGSAVTLNGSQSTGSIASASWTTFDEVVIRGDALTGGSRHGSWTVISDASAADGAALSDPDGGRAKIATALASPANYVDITFTAAANVPYQVWLRLRAAGNSYSNDSVFVQFNDSLTTGGAATARIGSTSALAVVLEEGTGAGVSGWGWNDADYGALAAPIMFATAGEHTLRLQRREDGAIVDQIVLSTDRNLTTRPGQARQDDTIVSDSLDVVNGLTATHTFEHAGTYPLELRVKDAAGNVSTATTSAVIR